MILKEQPLSSLPVPLLNWYDENRRVLPWREEVSAYRTWISEIMLQQTRVNAVIPYFERFMDKYPTIEALANSEEEELLSVWQGLGYYSRARNLKKSAMIIEKDFCGKMPEEYEQLIKLPGIGDYTAGAILSIAYGKSIPAVDGNVLRVASRIADYRKNILDDKNRTEIRAWMEEVIPKDRPGAFNQALMDLGAMICLPKKEIHCDICPAKSFCLAHHEGVESKLPVRVKKEKKKTENMVVFVFEKNGLIALEKRPETGLLANMWQLPNVLTDVEHINLKESLENWNIKTEHIRDMVHGKHVFTHIIWEMDVYYVQCTGEGSPDWVWCNREELETKALPTAFRKFLRG